MGVDSIKAVFFSATGTTKAVLQEIITGIGSENLEIIDITSVESRKQRLVLEKNELLIIGVPVYMGRIPEIVSNWLGGISADSTPAVAVVVYGNRMYDDALLELCDTLKEQGCVPFTGAAFIGEHSFSSPECPTAEGRPDATDRNMAVEYGREVGKRLAQLQTGELPSPVTVSGNRPYCGGTKIWDVDFIRVGDECNDCGHCVDVCPVGAIDVQDRRSIDIECCITCCACVKGCPQGARTIKPSSVKEASERLNKLYGSRREPELFW